MENLLMARFDVYPNPSSSAGTTPYLLDVQSDLFDGLDTRMVIPLRTQSAFAKVKLPERLMPVFTIKGKNVVLETTKMAAVPTRILKQPLATLQDQQSAVVIALDFLFNGY
jgi:toxin CcdB